MSIAQPPASVPYAELVKEQQAHAQTKRLLAQEREAHSQTKRLLATERQREQQRRKFLKAPFKSTEKLVIEEMQRQREHPVQQDDQGFTRFCYATAGINIGTDDKTAKRSIQAVLEQCPSFPIETKTVNEPRPNGQRGTIKRLYFKPTTDQSLLAAAAAITELEHKREQGGNQYQCQHCLSHNVMIKRRLHCLDCGHETDLEPTFPNGKLKGAERAESTKTNLSTTNLETAVADRAADSQENDDQAATDRAQNRDDQNQQPPAFFDAQGGQLVGVVIKTISPPNSANLSETDQGDEQPAISTDEAQEITAAAELLLQIAGDDQNHIEMSRTGEKKYYSAKPPRPLQFFDLVDHLRGGQARGALCSYQDGRTRGQCFDRDEAQSWEELRAAARKLAAAKYSPILEESPAERGGHLWIIYSGLVDAAAARAAVLEIAPELANCIEYWPTEKPGNRVRLPGGFYARYGRHVEQPVKAWCKLFNAATGETAADGVSAARLLLSSQTPAAIVPALPVISSQDDQTEPAPEIQDQENEEAPACIVTQQKTAPLAGPLPNTSEAPTIASAGAGPLTLPKVDARWIKDHGPVEKTTLWFAIIEEYAAAWFNEHNPLESIRPREPRRRMALSPNGNERTPSTDYYQTAQGERYTDHSAHGRRADGTKDTGDALELACKVQGESKSALLGETTREIIKQYRAELESAARAGQPIPADIEQVITPAGRRQYMKWLNGQGQRQAPRPAPTVTPAAVTIADQQPEPAPAPAALVTELPPADQDEAPMISTQDEQEAPAHNLATQQADQGEPRTIGTCLVEGHKTGKACGSTRWYPSKDEEYVCARCLSPIAWSRNIEAKRAR